MTNSDDVKTVKTTRADLLRNLLQTGVVDIGLWTLATIGAFALTFDTSIPSWSLVVVTLLALTVLKHVGSTLFDLHRQSWRKFGFHDARSLATVIGIVALVGTLIAFLLPAGTIPRALPIIDGLLSLVFMLAARGGIRYLDESRLLNPKSGRRTRHVLMIGAGEAGTMLVREMLRHPETGMAPVAFLDDDPSKTGQTIASVPVLGGLADLAKVIAHKGIDEVLICMPSADGHTIRHIVELVRDAAPDVACRTMPALHEILSGQVLINRIRTVVIDDLLRRPTVDLDPTGVLGYLRGKRVMVTGAGGSIGSELVRQICACGPATVILFGHGENSIYQLERELDVEWPLIEYISVIGQVQNQVRLESVFQRYQPDVIFHTAAHKHVPLMELNSEEAVFNNIIGSRNLVQLAVKYGITHFVNVSTDKAVNPTSVMGATKRIVEMLVEASARRAGPEQSFVSVRFGNVLGSRGSVVPMFKEQIAAGGPVTVTHPDMTRYFMTIPEAARLVLQASGQGKNGEIYILDMGEPVKILDLVLDLIRLAGLVPDVDIKIVFTGMRPGEKLYEELMTEREEAARTENDKIFVAQAQPMDEVLLDRTIGELFAAALRSDGEAIRRLLAERIDGAKLQMPVRDSVLQETTTISVASAERITETVLAR